MGSRLEANSSAVQKRIEKHKFDNEEGEEYEASKFGGFSDYFRRKRIKLQNLDVELRSSSSENPQIFRGVVAHVNGYTQPTLRDLHTMIVSHGGGFSQYLDGKTTVTHIIASALTPKKKIEFRRYRIVKPAWVVDSVRAGKSLPWDTYRVLDEGVGQQVLGFDNGNFTSQASTQLGGYRYQTDDSWYTKHVAAVADALDGEAHEQPYRLDEVQPSDSTTGNKYEKNNKSLHGRHQKLPISEPILETLSPRTYESGNVQDEIDPKDSSSLTTSSEEVALIKYGSSATTVDETLPAKNENIMSKTGADEIFDETVPEPLVIHQGATDITDVDQSNQHMRKSEMTAEDHNAVLLADPRKWKSTAVNPEFLKQYYEESRLHHLSSWKAELKSQLQALASEKSSSQKSREKRKPGYRRYILHVDFDCFLPQCHSRSTRILSTNPSS